MAALGAIGPLGCRAMRRARLLEQAGWDRRLVDLLLADAARRLADLLLGEGDGGGDHVAVGHLVDQAGGRALGLASMNAPVVISLQGLLDADGARQSLRAAGARNDAELDLGQPQLAHVLGRDAVVAARAPAPARRPAPCR